MMAIFMDFLDDIMEVFIDDFFVCGSSFEGCLASLDNVLERYVKVNLDVTGVSALEIFPNEMRCHCKIF